ncbi:MAG: CocE/NonD family hydrolase C-terminal non-catalytic domain-containing protein [Dehalococcoidia bacterium]|nr:CocE/NonD family hydrolase C-terminal non-catalytic domain-containing protein [Dehalococcoidia bacterium]
MKSIFTTETFPYEIELLPINNVFLAGHRIAIHITSSSFPMYDQTQTPATPRALTQNSG